MNFCYGEEEIAYLKSKDSILGEAIDRIGQIKRAVIPDIFTALINSIIGQQISTKAHTTVWERFQSRLAPLTPEHIASLPVEDLQSCGMTMKKAEYIKEIASSIADKSLDLEALKALSDPELCKRLSQIRGIGVWTAEMLMTFSMQRMNIISQGDLAIIRGLRMLYHHRKITPELFSKYKKRYSPYATVASLYLWEIASGKYENFVDLAPKAKSATA